MAFPPIFGKSKKCPYFEEKGLDCVNLWVKLSVQNVVLNSNAYIFAFVYFSESPLKMMKNIFHFMC